MLLNIQLNALAAAKPEIIAGFADSLVPGGSSVSLKCVVSGNPLPTVSWLRYDVPVTIYDSAHYTLDYVISGDSEATSFLNISAVGSEHGGTYKCEASNALSAASYSGQLTVYGKTHVKSTCLATSDHCGGNSRMELLQRITCIVQVLPI